MLIRATLRALVFSLVVAHVLLHELPEIEHGGFGDWLTPAHRDVFRRARTPRSLERTLVVLDPASLDPSKNPWDPFALQLAAPDDLVVLPAEHVLVASGASWRPDGEVSAAEQRALLGRPDALARWASERAFDCILVEKSAFSEALEGALKTEGYEIGVTSIRGNSLARRRSARCT